MGSLGSATADAPWLRACICVVLLDHNSTLDALHPSQREQLQLPSALEARPTSREVVRHVMAGWPGNSWLLDGTKLVPRFAKAALLQAGLERIATPTTKSIFFVCDADMYTRPGFFQEMLARTIRSQQAFVPIVWSTCFGKGVDSLPQRDDAPDSEAGFWRELGTGMVAVYKSDVLRMGGYRGKDRKREQYGEEGASAPP
jgi:hypothetical protein